MKRWAEIPIPKIADDYEGHFQSIRLNSLGSLFWFCKNVAGYSRFSTLHEQICKTLQSEKLFMVMELPMSTYKTRAGIALSIWWSLSFLESDERGMRELGYGDAWIRYMKAIHNQNNRTLITHEIAGQAMNIGRDVDACYRNNDMFRHTFPELIPDKECVWNNSEKFQKRLPGGDSGTATFVYRGVGQALQGIHANAIIQDDNCGKEAQTSLLKGDGRVMEDLIRWHKQVGTRFDPEVGESRRQLVIGNRWCHGDLNAWIRNNQPEFKFETHSAEGGCCRKHPKGQPIIKEWTMELLQRERDRLGRADYAHFYLNIETLPEEQIFDKSWLRKFEYRESNPTLPKTDLRNILLIQHSVYDGTVIEDIQPGTLDIVILVDPNHAKKTKRKKSVIWSIGFDSESARIYLLNLWAEESTYSVLVEEMYKERHRWTGTLSGPPPVYMGKLALKLLSFYLKQRDKREKNHLEVNEFDDDDSLAAMKNRIESLEPTFKNRQIWHHPSQKEFVEAVENYPACAMDALDVLGYFPSIVDVSSSKEDNDFLAKQNERFAARNSGAGGY